MDGTTLKPIIEEPNSIDSDRAARLATERPAKRLRVGYDCDICGTSYTEKRTLVRHERSATHCIKAGTSVLRYACEVCHESFARNDVRQRHEKEQHLGFRRHEPQTASASSMSQYWHQDAGTIGGSAPSSAPQVRDGTKLPEGYALTVAEGDALSLSSLTKRLSGNSSSDDSGVDVTWRPGTDMAAPGSVAIEGESSQTMGGECSSIMSVSTARSLGPWSDRRFQALRSTLLMRGASPRVQGFKSPVICYLCNTAFGYSAHEVRDHLDMHSMQYLSGLSCDICRIGFTHQQDLALHRQAAQRGHCGFSFPHSTACSGHHPPPGKTVVELSDHDRAGLCCRIRHWETSELQLY